METAPLYPLRHVVRSDNGKTRCGQFMTIGQIMALVYGLEDRLPTCYSCLTADWPPEQRLAVQVALHKAHLAGLCPNEEADCLLRGVSPAPWCAHGVLISEGCDTCTDDEGRDESGDPRRVLNGPGHRGL